MKNSPWNWRVCSADSEVVAEVGGEAEGGDGFAYGVELGELFALAGDAVADEVVPFVVAIFDGCAGIELLVSLFAGGRDSEEVVRVGNSGG